MIYQRLIFQQKTAHISENLKELCMVNVLQAILYTAMVYVFYKIFVNSICVIKHDKTKYFPNLIFSFSLAWDAILVFAYSTE